MNTFQKLPPSPACFMQMCTKEKAENLRKYYVTGMRSITRAQALDERREVHSDSYPQNTNDTRARVDTEFFYEYSTR